MIKEKTSKINIKERTKIEKESAFVLLSKYANPDLIRKEKNAFETEIIKNIKIGRKFDWKREIVPI